MPWELLYGMDIMVFEEGISAYTDTAAARLQVDWLDLIEPKQCRKLISIFEKLRDRNQYPIEVFNLFGRSYEDTEDVLKRYEAVIRWYKNHGHLVISNGAYYLDAIGTVTEQYAELKAFRDKSYPFTPRDFYVGIPKKIDLYAPTFIQIPKNEEIKFEIEVRGVPESYIKTLIVDPHTQDLLYTDVVKVQEGKATIKIPLEVSAKLKEGTYQIYIIASSDYTSLVSERTIEVNLIEKVEKVTETFTTEETIKPETTIAREIEWMTNMWLFIIILIAVAIIIGIIVMKKKPKQ
jgi:peptide/nickel transport system substrate-binding protein